MFCLIKNNIPNLHSELQFIKEFADSTIAREESSYRLTELEQAVHYIESLDWNVYDKDGILISVSILEKNLLEAMKSSRKIFFNIRNEFPRMLWLAEILLMIGTKREHKYQDYELDYVKYTDDKQYWDIAEFVFSSVGLTLFKSNSKTFLHFEHQYPQYLYTRLSTLIEQEIKRLI